MRTYTVNVIGHHVDRANNNGYHAYYANNVTAIEIPARSKGHAAELCRDMGLAPVYVYE